MKNYLLILITFSSILLVSCSNVNAESSNQIDEIIQDNDTNTNQPNMIVDVDTILDYRDSFKEVTPPTIEEIGEENLASYLFQQFNKDIDHTLGSCFCHMF